MKKLTALLIFLTIASLSFSQVGYPKWIVYQTDTVIAITEHQLDNINTVKIERDACYDAMWESNNIIDSLSVRLNDYKSITERQNALNIQKDSICSGIKASNIELETKATNIRRVTFASISLNIILIIILL